VGNLIFIGRRPKKPGRSLEFVGKEHFSLGKRRKKISPAGFHGGKFEKNGT
jgi:hypothetical protein